MKTIQKDVTVNRRAQPLNPPKSGVPSGEGWCKGNKYSATTEKNQQFIESLERKAGVR